MKPLSKEHHTTARVVMVIFLVFALTLVGIFVIDFRVSQQRYQISILEQEISDLARDIRNAGGEVSIPGDLEVTLSSASNSTGNINARVTEDTRALRIYLQSFMKPEHEESYAAMRDSLILSLMDKDSPKVRDIDVARQIVRILCPHSNPSELEADPYYNGFEMSRLWVENIRLLPIEVAGDTITYAGFFQYSGMSVYSQTLVANTIFVVCEIDKDSGIIFQDFDLLYE